MAATPKTGRAPRAAASVLRTLQQFESRNVTSMEPDGSWPIVWQRARGSWVWDTAGRRYVDLTAAFGVAAAGHANPAVVRAGQRQMSVLLHAMGDVHPHPLKAELARELSRLTFERWLPPGREYHGRTIFCNSGFEAVEAALKTAMLATGRREVIAFEGAYHGTGYGALNTTHRALFRDPFLSQLGCFGQFAAFPESAAELPVALGQVAELFRQRSVGAVLVEPVQGRGGIRVPPPGFLRSLRRLCDRHGALLIADEVYTGFGRTGRWFACEQDEVVPDVICLGKALTGGFPLSACVGRADVMDQAWPPSHGEAIHTSTYLGHPVGCAMALAQIREIRHRRLCQRSLRLGQRLRTGLEQLEPWAEDVVLRVRGLGLMAGLEMRSRDGRPLSGRVLAAVKALLQRGFIVLPEGSAGEVLSFTPPLTIAPGALEAAVEAVAGVFADWRGGSPGRSQRHGRTRGGRTR